MLGNRLHNWVVGDRVGEHYSLKHSKGLNDMCFPCITKSAVLSTG